MREIKFRGYSKEYEQWCYGYLFIIPYKHLDTKVIKHLILKKQSDYVENIDVSQCIIVDADSIGQYTGFKDKNGVEIYEGDIIQVRRGTKKIYKGNMEFIVEFSKAGMWEVIEKRYRMDRWDLVDYYKNSEVIGNIYEEKEEQKVG